ncbi:hypothetical protein PIB30_004194 [Stylosanthes scabra]|uniref:Cystatin domain-containing protein n=1 Tax=Stylosanthes scabra TaxID=79078 RepID=A0ABU6R412_9FABA|nr:hypothetical protein [Stylosanthes scabra]
MRTRCLIIIVTLLFLFCFDPPYYSTAFTDTATRRQGSSASLMSRRIHVDVDVNDPEVIEIADFAVSEHNKSDPLYLKLSKILSCTKLYNTFGGASYSIQLLADDGVDTNMYLARVFLWMHVVDDCEKYSARVLYEASLFNSSYQLQSFELIPPPLQQ